MIGNGQSSGGVVFNPADAVYQLLTENGDGTGNGSQAVNGSITPVKFFIQPPSDEKHRLKRMNVHGIDGNWSNATQYGALGGALANGIRIYVENDGGIIKEYTNDIKIKRTHDWSLLAGVDSINVGGAGADPLLVRWTFDRGCSDIVLDGANGERLVVEIADDLTGLDDHLCMVQGCKGKIS
jgi:hypothetical protein